MFIAPVRRARILNLALPIIGGMVSQNILNLVDTAMVGHLGDAALAAVGMGGFAVFMAMAIMLGISVGVQAISSRRKGEGRHQETAIALNAGLLIVTLFGPPLSVLLFFAAPLLYPYLNTDPEVIALGTPYFQIRLLTITFVASNFAFRGYWNATDRSRLYMTTLLIMHACNIFLNYCLIFGNFGFPQLGVTGAGIGTAVSTAIGTAIYYVLGFRHARDSGFLQRVPRLAEVAQVVRFSLPSGIQQLFFSAGMTAMYWIVGRIGTLELAAANVLINLTLVALLPGMAFGMAAATLVGQALGRGDVPDARQWAWDVAKIAAALLALLGVPMCLAPDLLLQVFLHNEDTVALARLPMRIVGITMAVEALSVVLMQSLLGAGDTRQVMRTSILCQWAFFLPLAYLVGPVGGFGLLGVWLINGVYRGILALLFVTMWRREHWASIRM